MRIAVCAKQVIDPDVPPSQFKVDEVAMRVVPPPNVPPVVNGFDLNATEAALRIRDAAGGKGVEITILSVGTGFVMDVMKRPLSMGADRLVLVEGLDLTGLDAAATGAVLVAALLKEGPFDLVLCGRQASDWDQAQVPVIVAEALGMPCVTLARAISVQGTGLRIERVLPGIRQTVECPLPAVVSVSNELGEPRYPTLRGIMAATRKQPLVFKPVDLGISSASFAPKMKLVALASPERRRQVEFIKGDDDADSGRLLALRLRQEKLI